MNGLLIFHLYPPSHHCLYLYVSICPHVTPKQKEPMPTTPLLHHTEQHVHYVSYL